MANNFKIFDETGVNRLSDATYSDDEQRRNGVNIGLARSKLFNKAMHQASMFSAALGEIISTQGGNASDGLNLNQMVAQLTTYVLRADRINVTSETENAVNAV